MKKREGFTNEEPRIATAKECNTKWGGLPVGQGFRCYLCGHKFEVGDYWRWVYANGTKGAVMNFKTCKACDGPDVLDRWVKHCREFFSDKFWALHGAIEP